jgi:hypothetical protein
LRARATRFTAAVHSSCSSAAVSTDHAASREEEGVVEGDEVEEVEEEVEEVEEVEKEEEEEEEVEEEEDPTVRVRAARAVALGCEAEAPSVKCC